MLQAAFFSKISFPQQQKGVKTMIRFTKIHSENMMFFDGI